MMAVTPSFTVEWLRQGFPLARPCPVAHEAPLEFLLDDANYRRGSLGIAGQMRTYWAVPWQEYLIWGTTAGMLVCLRESLLGMG